jgi:tetratricopeptide (TPR) repeat protein
MSPTRRAVFLSGGLIVLATCLAYLGSLDGAFVYDDFPSIHDNPTIRHLGSWRDVLNPPGEGRTVNARPLLNFSLALNYAIGGTAVRSYHLFNLAIHALAGLALFGCVRRTLFLPKWRERFGPVALPLALGIALCWVLHPLQTESVTYVIQRAESLMGLCYLLTFYCFIRALDAPAPPRWHALAIGACLLGMATKEVMVSVPVLVLLYDRALAAGSFREAWQRRGRWHLALAATWIPLAWLVASGGGNRGGSVGFGAGVSWVGYWLTQFQAVVRYLALSVWPHPLVFEYGPFWTHGAADVLPYAALVVPLLFLSGVALWRSPVAGFLAGWFWAILAPTSLMAGGMQMVAEHRMYLALVPLVIFAVAGLARALGPRGVGFGCILAAVPLGLLTSSRNLDYRSATALWNDTVAKRPANVLARTSLGSALLEAGHRPEAIAQFEAALRVKPDYAELHNNLGHALVEAGRPSEARTHFEEALRLQPENFAARDNLGNLALQEGRPAEALTHYEEALRQKPDSPAIHVNLGNALVQLGRVAEAIDHYETALRLDPTVPGAHYNYGLALARTGKLAEAVTHYEAALRTDPSTAATENSFGTALARMGKLTEAIAHFEAALQLDPGFIEAHFNLATALQQLGRPREAITHLEAVLQVAPEFEPAREMLAALRRSASIEPRK